MPSSDPWGTREARWAAGLTGLLLLRLDYGPPDEAGRWSEDDRGLLDFYDSGFREVFDPTPVTEIEAALVRTWLAALPSGCRLLDVGCGYGRHALGLEDVHYTGVDNSPCMLEEARKRLPGYGTLLKGDLRRKLPVKTGSADAVLCALTIGHLTGLAGAVREIARVLHPAGRALITEVHPQLAALGGVTTVQEAGWGSGTMRKFAHPVSAYLGAFQAHGLRVHKCHEIVLTPETLRGFDKEDSTLAINALTNWPAVLAWEVAPERTSEEAS